MSRILASPILQQFNNIKPLYLKTDVLSKDIGLALYQLDNSDATLDAVNGEIKGAKYEFNTAADSPLRLLHIAFGCINQLVTSDTFIPSMVTYCL